ncbi:hypothetical protein [Streptomyces albireticuli]|uniref:Uncharacterized protein n=1 Tax=Streptomyces albireticuli TaxID=1940 RepID=A0A2A2DBC9_9ACTN|nr:hypothetical protein [Streptomyces albireticuli]MCD9145490.1 hypothetical protein [Streptomyces albireticuli]MCD9164945.1 hypothetical protein [Streptomyces albireticuli]MCD9195464.1 hypothetical protein [Streptomyces albireticuli]PAU48746.1 hypothetical protein CK936_11935 [Streptomyces albireticuli]
MGWLIGFALPQRQECANVLHVRRAWRARIAAEVPEQQPGLGEDERRRVIEDRLREQAAVEATVFVRRREEALEREAWRAAARAAAEAQAVVERERAVAAESARQCLPCEDCGQARAAGLCEACGYRRETQALIEQAGLVAAAPSADPRDEGDVAAEVRASVEGEIARSRGVPADGGPGRPAWPPSRSRGETALAYGALQTVQQAASEYHRRALAMLGRTQEAEAEARRVYATEQNRWWFRANPTGTDCGPGGGHGDGSLTEDTTT